MVIKDSKDGKVYFYPPLNADQKYGSGTLSDLCLKLYTEDKKRYFISAMDLDSMYKAVDSDDYLIMDNNSKFIYLDNNRFQITQQ